MENIVTAQATSIVDTFKNAELKQITEHIFTQFVKSEDSKKAICVDLAKIYNSDMWNNDFSDFGDYTENVLNISKSVASRMRNVADRFITNVNSPIAAERFTVTQMRELLPLSDEEIINSAISSDMTIKEIASEAKNIKCQRIGAKDDDLEEPTGVANKIEADNSGDIEPVNESFATVDKTNEVNANVVIEEFADFKELSVYVQNALKNRINTDGGIILQFTSVDTTPSEY